MTAVVMDGAALAWKVRAEVAREAAGWGRVGLATVLVGDDPASHLYIGKKHEAATEAGFEPSDHRLPASTVQAQLLGLVDDLNRDAIFGDLFTRLANADAAQGGKVSAARATV